MQTPRQVYLAISATLAAVLLGLSSASAEIGQWDFDSGNLVKTAGADLGDLMYFDGPGGATEMGTAFGSTASFGIPSINGTNALVMKFPKCTSAMGYLMPTPTTGNGTNDFFNVNNYTLVMDLLFTGDAVTSWRALLQISPFNGDDGDLFINGGGGIGISGNYPGQILSNTWHRVGFVFDLTNAVLRKYIDGTFVGSQGYTGQDGRFSLPPFSNVLLFTDNDDETAEGYVNSIQLRDWPLSNSDMIALGSPSAAGIPIQIPVMDLTITNSPASVSDAIGMTANLFTTSVTGPGPYTYQWYRNGVALPGQTGDRLRIQQLAASDAGNYTVVVSNGAKSATNFPPAVLTVTPPPPAFVTGQWDFNAGDLSATAGQPLQYMDPNAQAATSFGTTTSFGIMDINGQPANVMYFAPSTSPWNGFIVPHGVAPNGGGVYANQYTVIMDLMYPSFTSGYRALWQTNPGNTNDADIFFNGDGGLGISSQYHGTLTPDVWHRVVFAFDLTRRELGKYIDGTNVSPASLNLHDAQDLGGDGDVDERWSLYPTALIFSDEDGEVQPVYVSSIQIRNGRMTDASVASLGGPTASKIPGFIQATKTGAAIRIDWTGTVLESASDITGPWSPVTGAAHPYTINSPTGNRFYRAR